MRYRGLGAGARIPAGAGSSVAGSLVAARLSVREGCRVAADEGEADEARAGGWGRAGTGIRD